MADSGSMTAKASGDLRNYILVTAAYWADTLADGASRILVLFFFYNLGYTPFQLATIFVFYELFGIITNLVGGWLAARFGLKFTLFSGLGVQIVALLMLALAPDAWLVVPYVMASQALSGIAKDLTKMSSKSAVKLVVADGDEGALFRWVSILTGSKNALKGVGFFLGGVLLTLVGFQTAMLILAAIVLVALIATSTMMHGGLGTVNAKAKFHHMFSQNRAVNVLAAARIFLFASRDVWFVVGLPVFLRTVLGWSFWEVGGFLAIWVIGYGAVQASAPKFVRRRAAEGHGEPDGRTAALIAFVLAFFPAAIAIALSAGVDQTFAIIVGLAAFGVIFAVNSIHTCARLVQTLNGCYDSLNDGGFLLLEELVMDSAPGY